MAAENTYGRSAATKTFNAWAGPNICAVSPTTNIVGIVNAVRSVLDDVGKYSPLARGVVGAIKGKLSRMFSEHLQASGKPDLFVCLNTDTHPLAMAVEVKGAVGRIERGTLRDNQLAWAKSMTWKNAYWIFLWVYEGDKLPTNFRSKAEQAKRHVYLIPLLYWTSEWNRIEGLANTKTLHYRNKPRGRKALRKNDLTIEMCFGKYALVREAGVWRLGPDHALHDIVV